jgi:tRNA(adenine34) deaminase
MIRTRRAITAQAGVLIAAQAAGVKPGQAAAVPALSKLPQSFHEHAMRAAIEIGRKAHYPFGAVIVRPPSEKLVAKGANDSRANPTYHGEIVCMDNYVALRGNQDWDSGVLYTTAEPCPMCMAALIWAGIGGVVYGTSIGTLSRLGMNQLSISASEVIASASSFRQVALLGGILANETDALFAERIKPPGR